MKIQYVDDRFKEIQDSIDTVKNANLNDPKLSAMLSSYLVVFISGVYEDVIEYLFVERCKVTSDKQLELLVKNLADNFFRNPYYGELKKWLGFFDPLYAKELEGKMQMENKDGLNNIVDNKNKVAHGEYSSATISDVDLFHTNALKIFVELEKILCP